MNTTPVISVIMAVFNARNKSMINASIKSIQNQSFSNFELIICNDGSTNGCWKYIEKIAQKDDRIILIQNERNMGLAYSLNRCIEIAKGKYIARMDIDDISCNNRLEEQIDFLEKNKQYGLVCSNVILFDDQSDWGLRKYVELPQKKDFLFAAPFCHVSTMFRREIFNIVGGYHVQWDTKRAEDYELYMRIYEKGIIGYNIQTPLVKVREDKFAYKRRSYRHRFEEAHVRLAGFYKLGLYPKAIPYVLKPLIVGLIPQRVLRKMRKEEKNEYGNK